MGGERRREMGTRLDRRPPPTTEPAGGVRGGLVAFERSLKERIWDCRMCGQCILHSTGMSCTMRCPKNLRNGPCGGVLQTGRCEVLPERPCVWVQAWEGSQRLPLWRDGMTHLNKPVDWRLQETSSWANFLTHRDAYAPAGWRGYGLGERAR